MTIQLCPLEVTQALLNCAQRTRFQFGEDTALIAVQHMLLQTVDLFKTIGAMGLSLNNCFALGKVYSNSPLVIEALREMGVTVLETTVPAPGEFHANFERDVTRLWNVATEALAPRNIKRILVLDDAGVCINNTPAEVLQRYDLCGVEQTTQGVFLFEQTPPPFAVISWARSAVKLEVGGPIFSQAFVEKLQSEFLDGASMTGAVVGTIGLGSIGRSLANLMEREGAEVFFYDPNPAWSRYVRDGIARVDSLADLMLRCDYIIGCSGRHPFTGGWPLTHRPGVSLLSASGGDQEFGSIIKDLIVRPGFTVNPETWDITSEHGPSGPIRLAYLGYPYNFVSRSAEAVPTRIVQLETGGLLAALMQARIYLEACERGEAQNSGFHRVSPQAQCFVYESWLGAMAEHKINIAELFAYDPEMLSAAQHEEWFAANSEPRAGKDYEPLRQIEETMTRLIRGGDLRRIPRPVGA